MVTNPTLDVLRDRVYQELRRYSYTFNQSDEADGLTTDFSVLPGNICYALVQGGTWQWCTVDGVVANGAATGPAGTTEVYVVSCEEGNPNNNVSILQYPTAADATAGTNSVPVDAGKHIRLRYDVQFWSDDMVYDAINAAIMSFYSFFAVEKFWTTAAVMNQYEYALPADCQYIRRVQIVGLTARGPTDIRTGWEPYDDWGTLDKDGVPAKWLRLFHPQWRGSLRVIYFAEPTALALIPADPEATPPVAESYPPLSSAGVHPRGQDCFVYEACFKLLHDVLAPRISVSAFGQTDDPNMMRMLDIQRGMSEFHSQALEEAQRVNASPRLSRM